MRTLTKLLLALILAVPALAGGNDLPVKVNCQHGPDSAEVEVRFLKPASEISIKANALDGLELVALEPLTRSRVAAGEVVRFTVRYRMPDGPAGLNITVNGRFPNAPASRAYAFIFQSAAPAARSTDSKGREVLVVPAR